MSTKFITIRIEVPSDTNESVYVDALTHIVHGTIPGTIEKREEYERILTDSTIDIEQVL